MFKKTTLPTRFTTPISWNPKTGKPLFLMGGGSLMSMEEIPPAPAVNDPANGGSAFRFTSDDLERVRAEEKTKLYARLDQESSRSKSLEEQVSSLLEAQKSRENAEAESLRIVEQERKAREEEELSARDLLARRESELSTRLAEVETSFESRLAKFQEERELERAVLEKDRSIAELRSYITRRVSEETDQIAPELRDFISGNTEEEVERSIEVVKAKSEQIASQIQNQMQSVRQQQRGVSPTGYAAGGPVDIDGGQRTYSAADIQAMSAAEYADFRTKIGMAQQNTNRGLFG